MSGPGAALLQELRRSSCNTVTDRGVHDVGAFHRGPETWLLLGSRQARPPVSPPVTAKLPVPVQPTAPTRPTPPLQPQSTQPAVSAARALELGYDAVLLNTAIAKAADPVAMATAFRHGVEAGRAAAAQRRNRTRHITCDLKVLYMQFFQPVLERRGERHPCH